MTLREQLALHPRIELTRRPTPLQRLDALSAQLDLDLWIKRDDLTDLALGGDKPRKLEFELPLAIGAGDDTLVTCGSSQSNLARLVTAAARRIGMECCVVLSRDEHTAMQANLLTVQLMGAETIIVDVEDHWDLESHAVTACSALIERGRRPYYIPVSGSTPTSCLAYVDGALEILQQASEHDVEFDTVFTPVGTGGVFSGSLFGFHHSDRHPTFIGVSVNRDAATCRRNVERWWGDISGLLSVPYKHLPAHIELTAGFVGAEYGDATDACLDAIIDLATAEGILVDPVYSGKVFAALFDYARAGRLEAGSTVLVIHSGGVPAIFSYADKIAERLRQRGRSI